MNMSANNLRRSAAGFTLVEILVALLILGIMAALGYSTYRAARISAERTEDSLKRSREIEFGMRIIDADFAQLVPRPVRDILGQGRLPALRGTPGAGSVTVTAASLGANLSSASGSSSNSGMSFNSGSNPSPGMSFNSSGSFGTPTDASALSIIDLTRAGWSNTAGQQRSTLQRVSYALVGDVLKRSYQTNLDTVQGNKPVVQDLLTGVKGVQLRYLDSNQSWQNQWPESTTIQNGSSTVDLQVAADSDRDHRSVQGLGRNPPPDRGVRMKAFNGGRRQRGVALLIALILVALATVLATKLSFDGFLELRRTTGMMAAEQALHFGLGAEALAADVLVQDLQMNAQYTTLAGPWAQATQPLPITPDNNPEGEPIGTMQGALEDMQGRFNLNTLARLGPDGVTEDPLPLQQFQRLLASVGVEPRWAGLARDWLDQDEAVGNPGRR